MATTLKVTEPVQTIVDTVDALDSINYAARNHNKEISAFPAFIVDNFQVDYQRLAVNGQIYNVTLALECWLYGPAAYSDADMDTLLDEVWTAIAGISGFMYITLSNLTVFQSDYGGDEVRIYYFRCEILKRDST